MLLVLAVVRGRMRTRPRLDDGDFARGLILTGGALLPLVVLVALFVLTLRTLPFTAPARGATGLTIQVEGRQWFWAVRYASRQAVTANEIHIPVGVPVRIEATTADVIHSFWVPRLNRKIDMIPGRTNTVTLKAEKSGVYRGQCAEFCGLQHAKMAFLVFAEPRAQFDSWLANQARPAAVTSGRGLDVFTKTGCGGCHAIRGTSANGNVGPDLTHLASRSTLAAATIPNRRGWLGGWILDPQHVKPGNKMPGLDLTGPDLQQLLDYLDSLK